MAAILSGSEIKRNWKKKKISSEHLVMFTNPSSSRNLYHAGKDSKLKFEK